MGMQPFNVNEDGGNCAVDWQNWIRSFELFLKVNKIRKNEKKRDWLLHLAGPKVQEIYYNLPEEEIRAANEENNSEESNSQN